VSTSLNQGSARIYQFPVGGRAGLASPYGAAGTTATPLPSVAPNSSSWYHEAAVDEDRSSKPQ